MYGDFHMGACPPFTIFLFYMPIFNDDNGNPLPQEVQDRVNTFIDNLTKIPWFKPSKELKREEVEKQAKFMLECF